MKGAYKSRAGQKVDTLIVSHHECTECLDLYIEQGILLIPPDIASLIGANWGGDIQVCGNFPMDLLDPQGIAFESNLLFKVWGKTIRADTHNAVGAAPLFYVKRWEKFAFDKSAWSKRDDINAYKARPKMILGIMKNFLFEGQPLSELLFLLGKPDFTKPGEVIYLIEETYGSDIDPIATTEFTIRFGEDSVVTGKALTTYKAGG